MQRAGVALLAVAALVFSGCAAPMWAYWGLIVDTNAGWDYAMEGAASREVEPGQAVAFVWQFGDNTEPTLPTA